MQMRRCCLQNGNTAITIAALSGELESYMLLRDAGASMANLEAWWARVRRPCTCTCSLG